MKFFCFTIVTSMLVVWAGAVFAATVLIVHPTGTSPRVNEVLTLLHGELLSVGLDDVTVPRTASGSPERSDPRTWLEQLAVERDATAVIDIVGDDAVTAVDVWVLKSPGRFEVTRVAMAPDTANSSSRLAIRALEALRASLVEVDFRDRYRPRQPKAGISSASLPRDSSNGTTAARGYIGLEVGATTLMSLDGVGPAILPVFGVDWAARSWLVVQATMAGFGTRAAVTTAEGSARIAQEYAVLGGCYRFRPERIWWPYVSVATGILHTSVEGQSIRGEIGSGEGQWSLLADAGFGAAMRLYGSYHLALSGHLQVAHPYVAIHFGEAVVATTGRPNLHFDFTFGAWL